MTGGGEYGSVLRSRLGAHETLELHELTAFKTLCLTKAKTMPILVSDPALKQLMADTAAMDARHLADLDLLLARALGEEAMPT